MVKESTMAHKMKFIFLIIGIFIAGGDSVYSEPATQEIAGVRFDENIIVDGQLFKLENIGLLRYKIIFKVYAAALYLGGECTVKDVFKDVPKRLELVYFSSIAAEDLALSSDKVLQRNVSEQQFEEMRSQVKKLYQSYQDVKPKDRYVLTYIPGKGTEMILNAKSLITIQGADFAKAYFSIWLGNQPLDKDLRDTLLGIVKE